MLDLRLCRPDTQFLKPNNYEIKRIFRDFLVMVEKVQQKYCVLLNKHMQIVLTVSSLSHYHSACVSVCICASALEGEMMLLWFVQLQCSLTILLAFCSSLMKLMSLGY